MIVFQFANTCFVFSFTLSQNLTKKTIVAEVAPSTTTSVTYDWSNKAYITFVSIKSDKTVANIKTVPTILFSEKGPGVLLPLGETAPIIGIDKPKAGFPTDTSLVDKELGFYGGTDSTGSYSGLYNVANGSGINPTTSLGLAANLSTATDATITQTAAGFTVANNSTDLTVLIIA